MNVSRLFGRSAPPFYIFAPPLLGESAGVRLLYQLGHALNSSGAQAWMVPDGTPVSGLSHSLAYTAPQLTADVASLHFNSGMTPVVVYSESIRGNPLQAPVVARWLLNSPGLLGGPSDFPNNETMYAYTSRLARESGPATRLFLPTTDVRELDDIPRLPWRHRGKSAPIAIYAAKYQQFVGRPRLPRWTDGRFIVHLEREGPHRQSRAGLLSVLANAHCLIAYENTAVISEAVLLGTPVVLIRSPFFPALLADEEVGSSGTAWSDQDDPIDHAISTVHSARQEYEDSLALALDDVDGFRRIMEEQTFSEQYISPLVFHVDANSPAVTWKDRASYGRRLMKERGGRALLSASLEFASRRLSNAEFKQ